MCKIILRELTKLSSTAPLVSSAAEHIKQTFLYTHRQPMTLNKELFVVNALINTIARERARIDLTY